MKPDLKRNPYKLEPSASPTTPNSGYRWSGLFMAGLAGAILVILGVIWAWQGAPGRHVASHTPPPAVSTTTGSGRWLTPSFRTGAIDPTEILTQVEPPTKVIPAYEAFDKREPGWIKVELKPAA